MSTFNNVYYKRTAATAKSCYVCYKPTTTVLATIDTTDFLYTCPGHLSDVGFATKHGGEGGEGGGRKMGLSEEEIAKVKEEWEEKERRKKKEGEGKEKEKEKEKEMKSTLQVPAPLKPVHERYVLHRDFFTMRQREHRKRRQTAQAQELAPRLPGAPRGVV